MNTFKLSFFLKGKWGLLSPHVPFKGRGVKNQCI